MNILKVTVGVESVLYNLLREVSHVCAEMQLDYFVGGAMARDILIKHVHGHNLGRATRDVDIGLYIKEWTVFERLKAQLIATGRFNPVAGVSQRLIYKPFTPLDLIPFGGITDEQGMIAWPPENDIVLNVAGFEEALAESISIDLGGGLVVKTCSIPSLVALKLIAWGDRHNETNKDASDFFRVVEIYGPGLNTERLYDHEMDLLTSYEFDPEPAGACLLGKDTVHVCKPESVAVILGILQDKRLMQRLIDQITMTKAGARIDSESSANRIESLVNAFYDGFKAGLTT